MQGALSKVKGVSKISFASDRSKVAVDYDPEKVKVAQLISAVKDLGQYGVKEIKDKKAK